MLSILIPTYNYNIFPLVESIHKQCNDIGIPFEIIVLDDASDDQQTILKNRNINTFFNCSYELLAKNIGRSSIRNLLAQKATYTWMLFLDADVLPEDSTLIAKYIPHLNEEEKIVYGGIKYQKKSPEPKQILRWIYGNQREALNAHQRNSSPYLSLLTLNFAVNKAIFAKVSFNETIPNLRYEDVLFSYEMSIENIKIEHIDNPVFHMGLDTSEIFLLKSEDSVKGLKYLLDNKLLPYNYLRLANTYKKLKALGLKSLTSLLFRIFKNTFKKNLLSPKPSLLIFDLYRLGYLSSL